MGRRSGAGLKSGFPPPRTTGTSPSLYSSMRPARVSEADRSALPKISMSWPGCCFNRATSPSASEFTSRVLFQPAWSSVREKTTLGMLFMMSATSPVAVGQCCAMPW